jgi:hypothetical protein
MIDTGAEVNCQRTTEQARLMLEDTFTQCAGDRCLSKEWCR